MNFSSQAYRCIIHTYTHQFSSLGGTFSGSSDNTSTGERGGMMNRMQFWRLLKDCQIYHLGLSLFDADLVIGAFNTKALMYS